MKKYIILGLLSAATAASAAVTPFADGFDLLSLDAGTWTSGGYFTPVADVTFDGELLLSIQGAWQHSHHSFVQTVRSDFDFFSEALEVTWVLGPSGLGTGMPYVPNPYSLWGGNVDRVTAGWGITSSTTDNALLDGGSASSLFFGVTFLEKDEAIQVAAVEDPPSSGTIVTPGVNLDLVPYIMGQEIDAIPTAVSVVLDGTNAALTLTGANFVSTGTGSLTVAHGKSATDFSAFYLTGVYQQQVWTEVPIVMSTDSISVTSVPEPAAIAAVIGLLSLGLVIRRRRRA